MTENARINLIELLANFGTDEGIVFADDYLSRRKISFKLEPSVKMDVIADCIDSLDVECLYVSLSTECDREVEFVFTDAQIISDLPGKLIGENGPTRLFWLGDSGALRQYDDLGRITSNEESALDVVDESSGFRLAGSCKAGCKLEFTLLWFRDRFELFRNELLEFAPFELKKVVRNTWFCYESLSDVWNYLINGDVFSTWHVYTTKGWKSQNLAYALYYYLDFLLKRTQKQIYRVVRDLVAYSMMLSLPPDGRWRHGIWTDLMEAHLVHQVSGCHVFLSYYEETGNEVFLEKARLAGDYLLSCVDRMDGKSVWFLHDSLEEKQEDARLHYANMTSSRSFGKSESNTLCLNNHIWTMTVLHRISKLTDGDKSRRGFEEGATSLKRMLQESPCSFVYWPVYRLRDLLVKLVVRTRNKKVRQIQKRYDNMLRKSLLPALKRRFPRFVMPNGFTERDLCFSPLSDFYHLLNIKDLLFLYSQMPEEWLLKIIRKTVTYTIDSELAKYMALNRSRAVIFLEILFMYSALIDERALSSLLEYFKFFEKLNLPIQVDILSNPLIVDPANSLCSDNEDVVVLAPADSAKFVAVILNLADTDIKTCLSWQTDDHADKFDVVDSQGNRFSFGEELMVSEGGYLKVVRKNG